MTNIDDIKLAGEDIAFVRNKGEVVFPEYAARENLKLWYDFSGRTNADAQKAIAEDLSGNGNNGTLSGFAYETGSGYDIDALLFDGIDDFISIPKPQIDLNNFTYSEGINVLSFRGDEVATVVDGVVEIGGRNLFQYSQLKTYAGGGIFNNIHYNVEGSKIIATNQRLNSNLPGFKITATTTTLVTLSGYTDLSEIMVYYKYFDDGGKAVSNQHSGVINVLKGYFERKITFTPPSEASYLNIGVGSDSVANYWIQLKLEKGNKATDWSPAPEDLETTTFKPLFDKKIKSALYWNRALTDEELLQVYNTQLKRI